MNKKFKIDISEFPKRYIGHKSYLAEWIVSKTPDNVSRVLDACCGTAIIAYYYKMMGMQVFANDLLRFNSHWATAIIEMKKVSLTDEEAEPLFHRQKGTDDFVEREFRDLYFEKKDCRMIDTISYNIRDRLTFKQQSVALAALAQAIISKSRYGRFTSTNNINDKVKRKPPIEDYFIRALKIINSLTFDNGRMNSAMTVDIFQLLKSNADLFDAWYFDPPYVKAKGRIKDYEFFYHFVETVITYPSEERMEGKLKMFRARRSTLNSRKNCKSEYEKLFFLADPIPVWMMSYNDDAIVSVEELTEMFKQYRKTDVYDVDYKYKATKFSNKDKENKEVLLVGVPYE